MLPTPAIMPSMTSEVTTSPEPVAASRLPARPDIQSMAASKYPFISDREGEEEDDRHDAEEYRDAPQRACKNSVGVLREHILALFVEHDLFYYLAYEVVLLVDDVRLVAPVEHIWQLYGIFPCRLRAASARASGS